MATVTKISKPPAPKDLTIHFFPERTAQKDLQSPLRKKWDWVVTLQGQNALWYSILIANLHQSYKLPEVATMASVRNTISKGFKRTAFDRLKLLTQASRDDLLSTVRIPARTLARRETFHPDESERILRIAAAFQRTIEALEDLEGARHWFTTPKRALGDQTPLQFCDTEVGAGEVMNLLGRIEHGVFS